MGLNSYMDMPMMVIVLTALSADREGEDNPRERKREGTMGTSVKN